MCAPIANALREKHLAALRGGSRRAVPHFKGPEID